MKIFALAVALVVGLGGAAVAQMCGGNMQLGSSNQMGGMGCMAGQQAQSPDPMADNQAHRPMMSGMCPCCRNMANMGGMKPTEAEPKQEAPPATPKQ